MQHTFFDHCSQSYHPHCVMASSFEDFCLYLPYSELNVTGHVQEATATCLESCGDHERRVIIHLFVAIAFPPDNRVHWLRGEHDN